LSLASFQKKLEDLLREELLKFFFYCRENVSKILGKKFSSKIQTIPNPAKISREMMKFSKWNLNKNFYQKIFLEKK